MPRSVSIDGSFESWRGAARGLLQEGVHPLGVHWHLPSGDALLPGLFDTRCSAVMPSPSSPTHRVPKAFLTLARSVAAHRDGDRFDLLYRVLWDLSREGKGLLDRRDKPDIRRLFDMNKAIGRDVHKMHAFVRFQEVPGEAGADGKPRFVAWHRPDHFIVPLATPFFKARFAHMTWSILTPDASAHWDQQELTFGPGCPRSEAPDGDALEDLWRSYYASIFNPARLNLKAMTAEMPMKHWSTLPEADIIHDLIRESPTRMREMFASQRVSARPLVPLTGSLEAVGDALKGCDICPHAGHATQAVFGEGPSTAELVIVGEQPGDREDREGRPFVGPAGQLLDRALEEAGIPRNEAYLTNAVKHFKFSLRRGPQKRIHQGPGSTDLVSCRPWLEAELKRIRPRVLLCLGRSAAQAILGRAIKLEEERGRFFETPFAPLTYITCHPSSILRRGKSPQGAAAYGRLVAELGEVQGQLLGKRLGL